VLIHPAFIARPPDAKFLEWKTPGGLWLPGFFL
jgi:hypothetical protein